VARDLRLACCAIEMMATGAGRYDLARFAWRSSGPPRQADLMIVARPRLAEDGARRPADLRQMPEPKWGHRDGGLRQLRRMFNNYAIVQGVDHIIPVDIYLPGCPPRPEMLMDAILKLHRQDHGRALGANAKRRREHDYAPRELVASSVATRRTARRPPALRASHE